MNHDRRTLLGGSAAVAVLAAAGCAPMHASRTPPPRLGIADITVLNELQADYQGTVRELRAIGFTHLGSRQRRWNPLHREEPSAAEKARIFREEGMLAGPSRMVPGMALPEQIEETLIVGADILAMSAGRIFHDRGTARTPTPAELDEFIAELNQIGRACRRSGVRFAYHNHDFDTVMVGGKRGLDRLIDETEPGSVFFELDLAWAHISGDDPVALAQRLGGRLVSLHLKDYDSAKGSTRLERMAVPGEGEMNYPVLLPRLWRATDALPLLEVEGAGGTSVGMAAARRGYAVIAPTMRGT